MSTRREDQAGLRASEVAAAEPDPRCLLRVAPSADVLDRDPALTARVLAGLPAEERQRHAALRLASGRQDFLAARVLARTVLAEQSGADALDVDLRQRCARCGTTGHGAPTSSAGPVSWSHGHGMVAAVARAGGGAVGVDVERRGTSAVSPGLLAAAAVPEEAELVRRSDDVDLAFLSLWTRKEALVKLGSGLDRALRSSVADLVAETSASFLWNVVGPSWVVAIAVREEGRRQVDGV